MAIQNLKASETDLPHTMFLPQGYIRSQDSSPDKRQTFQQLLHVIDGILTTRLNSVSKVGVAIMTSAIQQIRLSLTDSLNSGKKEITSLNDTLSDVIKTINLQGFKNSFTVLYTLMALNLFIAIITLVTLFYIKMSLKQHFTKIQLQSITKTDKEEKKVIEHRYPQPFYSQLDLDNMDNSQLSTMPLLSQSLSMHVQILGLGQNRIPVPLSQC